MSDLSRRVVVERMPENACPCAWCQGHVRVPTIIDHQEGIGRATDAYLEHANRTIDQVVEAVVAAYLGDETTESVRISKERQ